MQIPDVLFSVLVHSHWSVFHDETFNPFSHGLSFDYLKRFFAVESAQGVDGRVTRGQMGYLTRSTAEAARFRLTTIQKVRYALSH